VLVRGFSYDTVGGTPTAVIQQVPVFKAGKGQGSSPTHFFLRPSWLNRQALDFVVLDPLFFSFSFLFSVSSDHDVDSPFIGKGTWHPPLFLDVKPASSLQALFFTR